MRDFIKIMVGVAAIALPAANASAEKITGLASGNRIVTFDSATPGTVTSSGTISGLNGAVLTGIDRRPADRQLYSLATNGNLFRITRNVDNGNYTAALVANINTNFNGARFGIDFNPVPDRLRFVDDFDRNLRINPNNGVTIIDGAINGPGSISLVGAAYTNSFRGAATTTLYALDASGNELLRSTSPNMGTYVNTNTAGVAFGPLGASLGGLNNVGFDISGITGSAFFNSGSAFYSLNLTSGAASLIGNSGAGSLVGLTAGVVPEPATWAMMILGFGVIGGAMRRRAGVRSATLRHA